MKKTKRRRGRPRFGRLRFTKARINKLPEEGTITEYARILGVDRFTVYSWIAYDEDGAPARMEEHNTVHTNRDPNTRWIIEKKPFVKWLIREGRYKPKGRYD